MLETLAGRLKWERTGQGIRVEIPPCARIMLMRMFWLILWCGAWGLFLYKVYHTNIDSNIQLFGLVLCAAVAVRIIAAIFWSLAGKTTLILDGNQLQIANHIMGLKLNKQTYANADVRGLRFVPSTMRASTGRPGGIWFIENNKLRQFDLAITETEAMALIDKMLQVYKFPIDSAWEYRSTSA
jgi:hypothetical protein